jgi:hypothetical protein
MSRWKQDDATQGALYSREWAKTDAGKAYRKRHSEYVKEWRKRNREQFHATQKRAYVAVRLECLQRYSGKEIPECRCCGETIILFLQIDHIEGNGSAHRREIGMRQGGSIQSPGQKTKVTMGGNGLAYWLKKNGWPEGFRVLCANCNLSKRVGKYCPHEIQRGIDLDGNAIPASAE